MSNGGLLKKIGDLGDQRMRVAEQHELTPIAPPELFQQNWRRHTEGVARDLRHRLIRRRIATHKEGAPTTQPDIEICFG